MIDRENNQAVPAEHLQAMPTNYSSEMDSKKRERKPYEEVNVGGDALHPEAKLECEEFPKH